MLEKFLSNPWLFRGAILVSSIIIGFLIEKIFIKTFKNFAHKTKWHWDDVLVASLHRMPIIWALCGALYYTVYFTKLESTYKIFFNKTITVILIATVTIVLARLINGLIKVTASKAPGMMPSTTLFNRTTNLIVYLFGAFIILQNLNIQITPLLTALGVGGLAVALALQDTLGNLFSGIQIIITKYVKPGDYVKLESGPEGYVTDIKSRNTTIRSYPDNNLIIVPNTEFVSTIVTNYNMPEKQLWASLDVGVSYDSDLKHVESVAIDVAKKVLKEIEGGLEQKDPIFRFQEFGDSSINFNIRLFIAEFADQYLIKHEFIKQLHERFNQENIEIPFPIRTVHLKQQITA